MLEIGVKNQNLEKIIQDAKDIEKNSNQILDFTKKVKKLSLLIINIYQYTLLLLGNDWQGLYSKIEYLQKMLQCTYL